MKLSYVRLSEKGMQAANGRLGQALDGAHYELTLISNLRCIKVHHAEWRAPIYIPVERVDNYTPAVEPKQ